MPLELIPARKGHCSTRHSLPSAQAELWHHQVSAKHRFGSCRINPAPHLALYLCSVPNASSSGSPLPFCSQTGAHWSQPSLPLPEQSAKPGCMAWAAFLHRGGVHLPQCAAKSRCAPWNPSHLRWPAQHPSPFHFPQYLSCLSMWKWWSKDQYSH